MQNREEAENGKESECSQENVRKPREGQSLSQAKYIRERKSVFKIVRKTAVGGKKREMGSEMEHTKGLGR